MRTLFRTDERTGRIVELNMLSTSFEEERILCLIVNAIMEGWPVAVRVPGDEPGDDPEEHECRFIFSRGDPPESG